MISACVLLLPLVMCSPNSKSLNETQPPSPSHTPGEDQPPEDQEIILPSPTMLQGLYTAVSAFFDFLWPKDAGRQVVDGGTITISFSTLLAGILATLLAVLGFGSVGLLAAKALSIGTLALFLSVAAGYKHSHAKSSSGGQTVHYVPIREHHHEFLHDRAEVPYESYSSRKLKR